MLQDAYMELDDLTDFQIRSWADSVPALTYIIS